MKNNTLLHGLILLLVLIATATSIFYQTPEPRIEYVTVRSEAGYFSRERPLSI